MGVKRVKNVMGFVSLFADRSNVKFSSKANTLSNIEVARIEKIIK